MMKVSLVLSLALVVQSALPVLAQTEITFGENLQDSIACRSTDTLTFAADADDLVVIHVVELSDFGGVCAGVACLCFDQLVELRDAENHVLADGSSPTSNNNGRRYRTQVGPTRVPTSATYTLLIRDKQSNGRGEYRVFLQRVNAPERTEFIHSGEHRLSNLARGEVATFQFDALAGDRAAIDMTASDIGNLKPRLALFGPSGQAIALPDSGSIDVTLDDGGLFTLLAFSAVDELGSYRLRLEVEPCQSNADCLHWPCTTATCNVQTGRCEETVSSGHCLVDELCFDDGDHNPDSECEVCDAGTDQLGWMPAAAGTPCGDQTEDGCTDADSCDGSVCLANDIVCDDEDVCNGTETCDSVDGCQSGVPLDCDDSIPCTVDDCNPVEGCTNTADSPCCEVVCDDDNLCTTDSCSNGTCIFTPSVCDGNDVCETGRCDAEDGLCKYEAIVCPDGQVCDPNTGDCVPCTTDHDCDDGNSCTDDTCDSSGECAFTPNNTNSCDDADVCNGIEVCQAGGCVSGTPLNCDDVDICTENSCEPVAGCIFTPLCLADADCSDANLCTTDLCNDGCCKNVAIGCPNGEICVDGECKPDSDGDGVIDEEDECPQTPSGATVKNDGCRYFRLIVNGEEIVNGEGRKVPRREGSVVEVKAPAPPMGQMFSHWSGDVPAERRFDEQLQIVMDSDKDLTAVFQQVPTGAVCGACGNGAALGMIMALFGWLSLRFVSQRRRTGVTKDT